MNGVNSWTGKRLSGTDHLRQSVSDILSTPVGIATKMEADQLMAWKSYRVKLNRLVFTNEQEISWPSPPET